MGWASIGLALATKLHPMPPVSSLYLFMGIQIYGYHIICIGLSLRHGLIVKELARTYRGLGSSIFEKIILWHTI